MKTSPVLLVVALVVGLTGYRTVSGSVPGNCCTDTSRKPVAILTVTVAKPMTILTIRDTAASAVDISRVLARNYGELFTFIHQKGLKPGKVTAIYPSYQPAFAVVEAAIEIDSIPGQVTGRIKIDKIVGGDVVVVHYQGPYEQIRIAYTAIEKWLKREQREVRGSPFEVYLNDAVMVRDPFELRTDVCQLIK
ncbi:MAG: GyrI-like domain-containing protein [Puia sp.]|nr:GyrI-like domain-containing protein [Puia sp.]